MRRSLALLLATLLLAAACDETPADEQAAGPAGEPAPGPGLVVLTTVDPITDLAQQVLGDRGEVRSLVAAGDSHTFEPTPQDAIAMSEADLFLANGLGLNESAVALAETNLPEGAPIVTLADLALAADDIIVVGEEGQAHDGATHSHDDDDGDGDEAPNPHAWMDVTHAIAYVGHIADALADVDPQGEETYRANAADYTAELETLDAAILEATATIPEDSRVLVSYHDSWAYYAPRYGLEHIDAIQPSDYAQPSAAEVRTIVDEINAQGVPAVFGAREFPSDVLGTIAAETGATYIGDLSDDEFPGEPGDPAHSYIGMMLENARAITEGLGGDPSPLDAIVPTG
ncbi:MAG: metal ABC transporter substrate-binding protein [Egibacteraceae bacterium]